MKSRIKVEKKTILTMVRLYCKKNHHSSSLCIECNELVTYAFEKLDKCPFNEEKPICKNCKVHCYKPVIRKKIQKVMRFSGPRMVFYHPVLAIRHLLRK